MTEAQVRAAQEEVVNKVNELSAAVIRALQENGRLAVANQELTTTNTELTQTNTRLTEELEAARQELTRVTTTSRAPRAQQQGGDMPALEINQDFTREPSAITNAQVVRFLSKTSGMGGLANIKAYMTDNGVNAKRMRLSSLWHQRLFHGKWTCPMPAAEPAAL